LTQLTFIELAAVRVWCCGVDCGVWCCGLDCGGVVLCCGVVWCGVVLFFVWCCRLSNPFLSDGSPKNRQNTQRKHDHLNKQQAVATQIPTQFEQKLEILLI